MDDEEFKRFMIWTGLWFAFISALCFAFKNGYPLFLLFIWILGII